MTRPSQKDEERFYFKEFLRLLPEKIKVVDDDRERPDFEVSDVGGHRIGLEVSMYHNDAKFIANKTRRALEEDWELLRGKIKQLINGEPELESIHGRLFFIESCFPKKRELCGLARQIVEYTKSRKQKLPVRETKFTNYPLMNAYLNSLQLREVDCALSWDSNLRAGWIGIDADSLERLVAQKTENLESYSVGQDFDEYWLLVASGEAISQSMGCNVLEDVKEISGLADILAKSNFKKVFMFQQIYDGFIKWQAGKGWSEHCFWEVD